ncbi:MAG: hypothetical protein DMD89_32750 [Candidatus Rokuibacteriota bacterium]|nr:MAG: hypothetical protein DMD89_32750 [Candidatus Rokubacteria bacterium]
MMVLLWSWVEGYRTRAPALVAVIIMIAWADADGTCDAAARQATAAHDTAAECRSRRTSMRQVPASVPSDASELMVFRDVQGP